MAEHSEDSGTTTVESVREKITEKFHGHDSSSSSSSDSDSDSEKPSSVESKVFRLFGREKPIHKLLMCSYGGTRKYLLVHLVEPQQSGFSSNYWSTTCSLWSPPHIPDVHLPEDPFLQVALLLRSEINTAFSIMRDIASGRDLKKFLSVIIGLWILSIVGSCCNSLTLFYISFVFLHTVPVIYERFEDQVDSFAEKAMIGIKKQYEVFNAKVLSKIPVNKIPLGPFKDKKRA
ncbi:hypothetical protein L1049_013588 [Liquidambar formosana]|uniref:Reticulon-like protein n=1 Tax=Liquidambar formosana TaxID=63359 RepID=A0AAP0RNU5_LIQFO